MRSWHVSGFDASGVFHDQVAFYFQDTLDSGLIYPEANKEIAY